MNLSNKRNRQIFLKHLDSMVFHMHDKYHAHHTHCRYDVYNRITVNYIDKNLYKIYKYLCSLINEKPRTKMSIAKGDGKRHAFYY